MVPLAGKVGSQPRRKPERRVPDDMSGPANVLHDFRYAIRLLGNNRGFSAVAIATLALAIGANTAMFSFVNGMLLSPLPYPDSDRIVRVLERLPGGGLNGISTLNYLDWRNQNGVFEYIAAEAGWRPTLTGGEEPIVIRGARVSAHYFDIFGTKPAAGRTFLSGDDLPGKDRVVLLSHRLWETRFGSDPGMLGRDILLDGESHTVVGVLPKGGPFDRAAAQIWKPLAFDGSSLTRDFRWLGASGKLKPDVTLETARSEMTVIGQRIATAYPDSNKGWGIAVDPLADVLIGPQLHMAVTVLFAATLSLLLIGCANLANLALARSISRESEIAVRAALGASRWELARQLLIENLLLSACGGIVGVGVGYAMLKWIQSLIPPYTLPPAVDVGMDASVLLFTLTAAIVTGLLFGLAPAARTNPNLVGALKGAGPGTTAGSPGRRARGVLVVAEIALSFVLLVASGLLMRSFVKLLDVDPGFKAAKVLTAGLPVDQGQHPDPIELNAYLDSITAAVEALTLTVHRLRDPGVLAGRRARRHGEPQEGDGDLHGLRKASQLRLCNRLEVDFIRPVGQPQRAGVGPRPGQRKVVADAGAAMSLDRAVEDAQRHPGGNDLDLGDLGARRLVAHGIHQVRGAQRQQPCLIDLDA